MNADKIRLNENNTCERAALQQLAGSQAPVEHLPASCPVMAWQPITDANASGLNAELLQHWRITERLALYDQVNSTGQVFQGQ
ncbi:hypothetical protein PK28_15190 [Hymenobacter sp. DG25B]|uniref:hypothetical protein n=1 Tax=Hymenobacter sp. DG25B TaxID=1385664 RepID=UPI000541261B|nr:hypothetical protein [Hymenobacter sp. DG25B]AIZ64681.1 hypothetical protein PK28_15190 [Hymenobacter sp. DG25B]